MATVSSYFGYSIPKKVYGRKLKHSILVGIEIELERVHTKFPINGWSMVNDGSLKIKGKEFTIPVWNSSALDYINHLFESIETPLLSKRCSVHVHVDITSYTIEELRTLILLYTIFENALYRFSGQRWGNNFCVPLQSYLFKQIPKLTFDNLSTTFPKYAGIHFFPDNKLGTVEFRHMIGNNNPEYIYTWISLLTSLVQQARTIPYDDLVTKLLTMHSDSAYWQLAKDIFDKNFIVLNNAKFKQDIETGILYAKLLVI